MKCHRTYRNRVSEQAHFTFGELRHHKDLEALTLCARPFANLDAGQRSVL